MAADPIQAEVTCLNLERLKTIFMDTKKVTHATRGRGSTDELAVVKAAAWAWYQRGSGSDDKPMSEFKVASRSHRPSRYKLEAMNSTVRDQSKSRQLAHDQDLNQDRSLLDNYEIQSISRQLDYLIESSKPRNSLEGENGKYSPEGTMTTTTTTMNKQKKRWKGFWPRTKLMCGRREDVVVAATRRRVAGDGPLPLRRSPSGKA